MNIRLLAIALLAATLGAATVTFTPLLGAPAPELKAQRWEYKVVLVRGTAREGSTPADALTDQFNALAKDGWEYSGPVVSESMGRGGAGGGSHYVAFRRFKS